MVKKTLVHIRGGGGVGFQVSWIFLFFFPNSSLTVYVQDSQLDRVIRPIRHNKYKNTD